MKLKEFDLSAPRSPMQEESQFRFETRHVTALYERCFPGYNTENCWKLLIECVPTIEQHRIRKMSGVFVVEILANVGFFLSCKTQDKQAETLRMLMEGVKKIVETMQWPVEPFIHAEKQVIHYNFVNEWVWKSKWSPNRLFKAFVYCTHRIDAFRAWLIVQTRDGSEVSRILAINELPDDFLFKPRLGRLQWMGINKVTLYSMSGKEVASLNTDTTV